MSRSSHELLNEFPEKVAKIHKLKEHDSNFARLYDEYTELNEAVHKAETEPNSVDQRIEAQMRQTRAGLKIELWKYLKH